MMLKLIAIVDSFFGVAKNGQIPWSFKEDRDFFRQKTMGQTVIMGKNTYLSLPNRPLLNRQNCVISSTLKDTKQIKIYTTINDAVKKNPDAWIIGGAQVYNYTLRQKMIKYALLTIVKKDFNADLFIDSTYLTKNSNILIDKSDYKIVEYYL